MKTLSYSIIFVLSIIGCQNQIENETTSKTTENKNTSSLEQKAKADSLAKIDAQQLEQNKKRLEDLKKNFQYNEDEFNKVAWYIHNNQTTKKSWNRKCLRTHIQSSGYIYLEDQFYNDDWIFHSRIEVKIGDNIYKSESIPTHSEDNKTEISGGKIWENISYTSGKDNGIIKAIAESGDKEIKIRFVGREYYSDFTLLEKDKQAIKEGYELSELIKKTSK